MHKHTSLFIGHVNCKYKKSYSIENSECFFSLFLLSNRLVCFVPDNYKIGLKVLPRANTPAYLSETSMINVKRSCSNEK
jgi:hypothetical protein